MGLQHLLEDLALVCCTAALSAVLCHKLRQPVVLGYLLAGVLVGPHVTLFFNADEANVRVLSELGITLLMFSIGLGFSLRRFTALLPTAGVLVAIAVPLVFGVGFLVGRAFGWSPIEAVFAAATLVVSSSMLLERSLRDDHSAPTFRDLVFGVTIVEDLVAVILLAILTTVVSGTAVSAGELTGTIVRLAGFLLAMVVAGMLVLPPLVRAVARVASSEVSIVASVGLCFAFAWIARSAGYSVALGAFLAGMLIAESGSGARVAELVSPLRDVFAAVFFVSVGMLLDPSLVLQHWGAVLALLTVVIVGRAGAISVGAFLTGFGIRDSLRAGLNLAQIGEFSFILAAIGVESGSVGAFLYPVAVAVAVLAALLNPWLVRASPAISESIERLLPERLRTFASLYSAWLEGWRAGKEHSVLRGRLSRMLLWFAVDVVLLAVVIISAAVWYADLREVIAERIGDHPRLTQGLAIACAAIVSLPFGFGTVRMAARIAGLIAESALPLPAPTRTDPAYTPRRALAVSLQFALVLVAGLVVQAVTQPFVPPLGGFVVLLLVLGTLAYLLWLRTNELEGHVKAGAQVIAAALTRRGAKTPAPSIEALESLLPGIGHFAMLGLAPQSAAVGRSIGDLDLSAKTGASVVAIERDGAVIVQPKSGEVLRRGDVLALSGSQEAVRDAALLLARARLSEMPSSIQRSVRAT